MIVARVVAPFGIGKVRLYASPWVFNIPYSIFCRNLRNCLVSRMHAGGSRLFYDPPVRTRESMYRDLHSQLSHMYHNSQLAFLHDDIVFMLFHSFQEMNKLSQSWRAS